MKTAISSGSERGVRGGWIRGYFYICFFVSGFTSLVFEVLWSRQFVTVFGNSAYAISSVLAAYMAGLGLGGLFGGRFADRTKERAIAFGIIQLLIAGWALLVPSLLGGLRTLVPAIHALSPESLLVSTLARFGIAFAILLPPCFLMGATLPLLARLLAQSDDVIARRLGALYCANSMGAALGCLASGFWLLETFGLRLTNIFAVCGNLVITLTVILVSKSTSIQNDAVPASPDVVPEAQDERTPASLLLMIAFLNGLACLGCEVVWVRYLGFLNNTAYVFPAIVCVYLLGLGIGGWVYSALASRMGHSARALGVIELLLGIGVASTFVWGALWYAAGPPEPLGLKGMALLTVLVPSLFMGMALPHLCSLYSPRVGALGRRTGLLLAVNTAGTVFGSVLPLFVFIPWFGIQGTVRMISLLYGGVGLALWIRACGKRLWPALSGASVSAGFLLGLWAWAPSNLCQRVFLATDFRLHNHTDILFYREGRTGTAIVAQDRINGFKAIYVNGVAEVPASYPHEFCFKLLGDLGPMLHPNPESVLMICFGGGIAAGATTCMPEVRSLTVVDLESSVVAAARLLSRENNGLLQNPRVHVVIDDGRNYLLTSGRRWPVIVSDSTHPKSSDSWVLYTREFYELVHHHLTGDGVFVEWVPMHRLSTAEFKIILRTFQSVFPHASLWITQGQDVDGQFAAYALLVGTPSTLRINVAQLRNRLGVPSVRADLEPYGLDRPGGFLDSFLCSESALRSWAGDGPVNTDDLPYTQYESAYSRGRNVTLAELIEPMEELWPFLDDAETVMASRAFREELALRARADRLGFLGRVKEAYALLPDDARYRHLSRLLESGPNYVESLLKLDWNNPGALTWLANLKGAEPDAGGEGLEPIYQRVVSLDPDNAVALGMLGAIHLGAGDMKSAEGYLRKAVGLRPEFATPQYNLGVLFYRTGHPAEALQQWRKAALIPDGSEAAADQWGVCLAQQGRPQEAVDWFHRALEIAPASIPARLHLAALLFETGQVQEGLLHLRYVLKMEPRNPQALAILEKFESQAERPSTP